MSYNVVLLNIKDFLLNFIFDILDNNKNNQKMDKKLKDAHKCLNFYAKILIVWLLERA